jgi:hypothetical protein
MRRLLFWICASLLLFPCLSAAAQNPDASPRASREGLPTFIISGLHAYKDTGPEEAVKTWIKGSTLEGNADALSQANLLQQTQDLYGPYEAFEVIRATDLTPRTRVLYLALDYAKGPLFAKFIVYRSDQGWILNSFSFNPREDAILPTLP